MQELAYISAHFLYCATDLLYTLLVNPIHLACARACLYLCSLPYCKTNRLFTLLVTPIHLACARACFDLCSLFLQHDGLNVYAACKSYSSFLDLCSFSLLHNRLAVYAACALPILSVQGLALVSVLFKVAHYTDRARFDLPAMLASLSAMRACLRASLQCLRGCYAILASFDASELVMRCELVCEFACNASELVI